MPLYTVMTRLLGREPKGEDLPGSVIELDEDAARELIALGALEPAPEGAVATDGSEPGNGEGGGEDGEDADAILTELNTLTVKQLQFMANGLGAQLGSASRKSDIVAILSAPVDRANADMVATFLGRIAEARAAFKASQ